MTACIPAGAPSPRPFALYYGWPSMVNGAGGDIDGAAAHLGSYDTVVFGDALPFEGSDPAAVPVLERLPASCCRYGYVSLSVPAPAPRSRVAPPPPSASRGGDVPHRPRELSDVRARLVRWAALRAYGVLFDCAGSDYGVGPALLAGAVAAAHDLGMAVVVNAWRPADVESSGARFLPGDAYLAENDVVRDGTVREAAAYSPRVRAVDALAGGLGLEVWAVATTDPERAAGCGWGPGGVGPEAGTVPGGGERRVWPRRCTTLSATVAQRWVACTGRPPDRLAVADALYGADGRLALGPAARGARVSQRPRPAPAPPRSCPGAAHAARPTPACLR